MNTEETIGDLAAIQAEIHDRITEQADRFDFDEGVDTRDALLALIEEARAAVSLLETTMLGQLEAGVRQRGSRVFKRKRHTVKRWRHDLIAADLTRWARIEATDDDGVTSITKALNGLADAFRDVYVSPSTEAKVRALDKLRINRKAVLDVEDRGWKLEVEELDERED
jgi:hypothetical protein